MDVPPVLAAQGLRKVYGDQVAVSDVTFSVQSGERVGILGLNGAGKSTLLKLLLGATAPSAGAAFVEGKDVQRSATAIKRRLGYLPETAPLYLELTPLEQLVYFAELRGSTRPRAETLDALSRAGVSNDQQSRPIGQLSKGYRQRVALAQALLGSPPLLILDEPTDGLDPAQRAEVRRLIKTLSERHTVLLSTHVLPEAQEVCTRVLVLHHGRIALELPAAAGDLEARFLEATGG